jgi:hypothetical protein
MDVTAPHTHGIASTTLMGSMALPRAGTQLGTRMRPIRRVFMRRMGDTSGVTTPIVDLVERHARLPAHHLTEDRCKDGQLLLMSQ